MENLNKEHFTLKDIFDLQFAFQQMISSPICEKHHDDDRNILYREHCIFTIEEIIEGLREINHKPWKKSRQDDNIDKLKDELIDEFRFFINRCIIMGLTYSEFQTRLSESMKKTYERFRNNY